MNYIIFGGSGFIGTHLIHLLKETNPEANIYDLDIVMPGEEGVVPGIVEKNDGVIYERVDVRKTIEWDIQTTENDIVFNLAAVHRTPGHEDREYFETNIRGAENVTEWCEKHGIKKILFTSSIAPYGAAEELKTAMDEVMNKFHKISEQMYQQAQAAQGAEGAQDAGYDQGANAGNGDDNVVDADFTEVDDK